MKTIEQIIRNSFEKSNGKVYGMMGTIIKETMRESGHHLIGTRNYSTEEKKELQIIFMNSRNGIGTVDEYLRFWEIINTSDVNMQILHEDTI